jgi:hypothetical protein
MGPEGREGFSVDSGAWDAGSDAAGGSICAGVLGAAFGSIDALGLQLANMNRAITSRD